MSHIFSLVHLVSNYVQFSAWFSMVSYVQDYYGICLEPPSSMQFCSEFYRVFFSHRYSPKKLKYGKPRLGESTWSQIGLDTPNLAQIHLTQPRLTFLYLELLGGVPVKKTPCIMGKQLQYRVFFLTGTPPKSSEYKKVNLGQVRCIQADLRQRRFT